MSPYSFPIPSYCTFHTLTNISPLHHFLFFFFSSLILTDSTIQKIENILEISCPKGDELYISDKISMTKAVLIGTLHGDDVLTASIYKLLTEQMTYQNGIACISNSVTLVPTDKVRVVCVTMRVCVCVCVCMCVCMRVCVRSHSSTLHLCFMKQFRIFYRFSKNCFHILKYYRNPC
jgi:hypothetical protein